jgi:hypothetical protein
MSEADEPEHFVCSSCKVILLIVQSYSMAEKEIVGKNANIVSKKAHFSGERK